MAPLIGQRLILVVNVILVAALLLEQQTLLPNTRSAIEKQISNLMDESARTTAYTIETLQNDVSTLMEDATRSMASQQLLHQRSSSSTSTGGGSSNPIPKSTVRTCSESLDQDELLAPWFAHLCYGTYLEVGVPYGSYSLGLHQHLRWKGVLVESDSTKYELLKRDRMGELAIVQSGVFCDLERENCRPLQSIVEESVGLPFYFDFGILNNVRYQSLKKFEFSKVQFGLLLVRVDGTKEGTNLALRGLLETNGYRYVMRQNQLDWFSNYNWHEIYGSLLQ